MPHVSFLNVLSAIGHKHAGDFEFLHLLCHVIFHNVAASGDWFSAAHLYEDVFGSLCDGPGIVGRRF